MPPRFFAREAIENRVVAIVVINMTPVTPGDLRGEIDAGLILVVVVDGPTVPPGDLSSLPTCTLHHFSIFKFESAGIWISDLIRISWIDS
mmetsp:Transcript_21564/g.25322  ORF Transcript_21564/g.25322 Transcript_21564/m.25322 type:complete len:90 (+) Transcript_21564:502-771(+)